MSESYTFSGVERSRERQRLQRIEEVFDPATRRRLARAGLGGGHRCLEVGAGAGSIVAHLAETVGAAGRVLAVDLDLGYLPAELPPSVTLAEGDLRQIELPPGHFDVAHARYVLVHNADYGAILDRMIAALAPGGSIVVEEPDFTVARAGSGRDAAAFDRVNAAIVAMFADGGRDPAVGMRLPAALAARGLAIESVEHDAPLCRGGDPIAEMMRMSAEQLRARYLATGRVSEEDLAGYARFARDRDAWGIYYGTIGVVARKPA